MKCLLWNKYYSMTCWWTLWYPYFIVWMSPGSRGRGGGYPILFSIWACSFALSFSDVQLYFQSQTHLPLQLIQIWKYWWLWFQWWWVNIKGAVHTFRGHHDDSCHFHKLCFILEKNVGLFRLISLKSRKAMLYW